MSKFFRSSSSDSSSDDSVQNVDQSGADGQSVELIDALATLNTGGAPGQQSQLLLHALLEERCMNAAYRDWTSRHDYIDHDAVRRNATTEYQRQCRVLANHNLMAGGMENEAFSATRQRFRDGLDMLSVPFTGPTAFPDTINAAALPPVFSSGQLQLVRHGNPPKSLLNTATPVQQHLGLSQYSTNFDELGVLGKGGYGVVYHARHKLDLIEYAVKKIPISAARLQRIRTHGNAELDKLLLEPRTLASLDHPNIVRYHNAWIELSTATHSSSNVPAATSSTQPATWSPPNLSDDDAVLGADDDRSLKRVTTVSDDNAPVDVLFEHSTTDEDVSHEVITELSNESVEARSEQGSRPDIANGLLEETSESNNSMLAPSAKPCFYLHLQMGLYPMSLADFLSSDTPTSKNNAATARHCFHLQPSLSILLAIIDGLTYLHRKGIAHGDLKPANILVVPNGNLQTTEDSVDQASCIECHAAGNPQPTALNIRLGDFGLATALSHSTESSQQTPQAAGGGTAMYRPPHPVTDSASLDVYALGIIAFELLYKFSTRMERQEILCRLKLEGWFPEDIDEGGRRIVDGLLGGDAGLLGRVRGEVMGMGGGDEGSGVVG
ncbi:hypothetical protein LTR62_002156 [Meristemomyces frigidus]|uniref:Protein kinase domain-containing protein n=1 Tax=Meristemomyces frigidus TaxID=1508187 RepID=A0AAN7T7M5_9PEZI|nr:hypothetical protein LTR62_002156 [Meristemomyces frigidus]